MSYQKLSASEKRMYAALTQREPPVTCPLCAANLMPCDLLKHIDERCPRELPEPHPAGRWLRREHALRCAPSTVLTRWSELELLRTRGDGEVFERDAVLLTAWSRALGAL